MAIRADSYSTTSEVKAYTRHLLDGQTAFNSTTRPTGAELEKFIDRASSHVNTALKGVGLATPITNTTAKLLCDDWVTYRGAMYVELTQRGVGFSDEEGSRTATFLGLSDDAAEFAIFLFGGFGNELGIETEKSEGLQFTAMDKHSQRSDPDNTSREQPVFRRHKWDNS